ncbi:MAG: hypothetical protein EP326_11330 [Deltaproteobacteria bacterium]|nr:MAG: hypothetical protein EP326_11330 [Deltaproteobacteria bacterium]
MLKIILLMLYILSNLAFADDYAEKNGPSVKKTERFAGRFFIRNTLMEIFGKSAEPIIEANYFKAGKQVGGPCDIYEQVYHEHDHMEDPTRECPGGKPASKYPHFPKTNILRSSHLLKTCYELVYKQPIPSSLQGQNDFIKSVSKKFYPFGGDEKLRETLSLKFKKWDLESRKEALFTYCLSPGWQRL